MFDLLKESHAVLHTTPLHWTNLTTTLSPDLLKRLPAEGEWSAVDCLQGHFGHWLRVDKPLLADHWFDDLAASLAARYAESMRFGLDS